MTLPTVSIVGRPNVGKSSLFNRMMQRNIAVVDEQPGVTRDRNYAVCEWSGVKFYLIDTGGMVPNSKDVMEKAITDQTDFAIAESDLILLVVDTQVGPDTLDYRIAGQLKRSGRKVLLVSNKADGEQQEYEIFAFMKLGLGDPHPVSATVGRGIGDFLDQLVASLPEPAGVSEESGERIRVAVVGRPNVGKSSFINKLLGQERLIVTPIAGTTRDAVDTPFELEGRKYTLIDTAGLRKKYRVRENIEFYTTVRTDRALESCDVAVILLDASQGVSGQDQKILEKVLSMRRPAVLAVNKWDLIEKETNTASEYTRAIKEIISRYSFLPVTYISALTGQRVVKVLSLVDRVFDENYRRISTPVLNEFLARAVGRQHPPARRGKYIKLFYLTQTEVSPPTFVFFCNHPELIDKGYIQYLTNQLRLEFGFEGVPIRLKFREK